MKDATGELSTTVIAVVAIAAILAIFTALILPSMRRSIMGRMYCQSAVQCGECTDGVKMCKYYTDDNLTVSDEEISCECETE